LIPRGAALLERILAVPPHGRDAFVDELLGFEPPPPDVPDLPRGAVPNLPSGVEEILAALREAPVGPDDELVDLGAGQGRVAIVAHLLRGARTVGVEIQEPLVRSARARCEALGLTGVTFVHGDAAGIELDGSVFYLYAPFNGVMLAGALRRVEAVAQRRPVVVCAVALELGHVPWLVPRPPSSSSLTIYDSRPRPI
jgi:protein-L-isoaspartate O-methyltransferase